MGLFEGVTKGLDLLTVLLLELCDLVDQRQHDGAFRVGAGGLDGGWSSLGAEVFDAWAKFGVGVEEGVGDACLALHGLESDRLAAFDQRADGPVSSVGLACDLAFAAAVRTATRWARMSVVMAGSFGVG